jgi:DNA-binding YbaB/EbfC family protein
MGGLGNMGNLMKQAQKAMEQVQQMEQELASLTVEGSAAGGVVKTVVTGDGKLESITLDPSVVDPEDVEMLQDLIVTAVRDGSEKAAKLKEERLKQVTGGLGLPPGMF